MDGHESRPDAEEMAALQEQIDDARSEIERLQQSAANDGARAEHAIAEAAVLREDMRTATAAHESATAEAEMLRGELETTAERSRVAAQRYRDLIVRTEPALPAHPA